VTSPLTVPIAEALAAEEMRGFGLDIAPEEWLREARAAADACIAVIAALPADYTAVDVLAFLRGEDVPSEPLPVKSCDVQPCHCEQCVPTRGGAA